MFSLGLCAVFIVVKLLTLIDEGATFCSKCGVAVTSNELEAGTTKVKRKKSKKKILGIAVLVVIAIIVISNITGNSGNPEIIALVKNGTLSNYPNKTVGVAFDSFFSSPKWESGVTSDGDTFVNVRGKASFAGNNVNAAVQFFVDVDNGTFEYHAFEMNEVPQSNFIFWSLLEKIYE